jgi:UDP-GlcNAc3NAcA epimerase
MTTIAGARPQFVKAAAMSRAMRRNGGFRERFIHTGQHFDHEMSGQFFDELGLQTPDVNLGIANLSHGAMTGRMIEGIEADLVAHRPDAVLVYGDTNSTLAGALAAAKLNLPIVHLEAGMRSGRTDVPEEINRIVTDHVSALLLCSSHDAMRNLAREGLGAKSHWTGDVMYDVTLYARQNSEPETLLARLGLKRGAYGVLTLHRAENTADAARLKALLGFARRTSGALPLVFPLHPRTRAVIEALGITLDDVMVIDPLGYFDFHALLSGAEQVFTDSGGVQKEAYFHRVACTTLRDETEWVETIAAGWNRLWTEPAYAQPRRDIPDYGEGEAATLAVEIMTRFLSLHRPQT